jgi:hypothetical protein
LDLLLLDTAIRAHRQWLPVTHERIDVNANSLRRIPQGFLLVRTIHMQSLECRAIGVERITIRFNDNGDLKTQLPPGSGRGFAGSVSG